MDQLHICGHWADKPSKARKKCARIGEVLLGVEGLEELTGELAGEPKDPNGKRFTLATALAIAEMACNVWCSVFSVLCGTAMSSLHL